jgi:hypothetical protein
LAAVAGVALVAAQIAITESLDRGDARKELDDASKANLTANRALNAADRGLTAAQAALLSTERRTPRAVRRQIDPIVARHLDALEEIARPVISQDESPGAPKLTAKLAQSRLPRAFKRLDRRTNNLDDVLQAGDVKAPSLDRRLLRFAVRRLTAAEADHLTAQVNFLRTSERYRRACQDARFVTHGNCPK